MCGADTDDGREAVAELWITSACAEQTALADGYAVADGGSPPRVRSRRLPEADRGP